MALKTLTQQDLAWTCDPSLLGAATTADIETPANEIGQRRALDAVRFGADIDQPGYNVFVMGPSGIGKHAAVRALLEEHGARVGAPCDWAYVNNFRDMLRPRALRLEAGSAISLRDGMAELIDDLKIAIPATFEGEEFRKRRLTIDAEYLEGQEQQLNAVREKAQARGLALLKSEQGGFTFAAVRNNELVSPDAFRALPEEEQSAIIAAIEDLQKDLTDALYKLPRLEKERREKARALNREMARRAVAQLVQELRESFLASPAAHRYVSEVEEDLIENTHLFLGDQSQPQQGAEAPVLDGPGRLRGNPFRRYEVNVLVTNDPTAGVPVVFEPYPALGNLVGRIEHIAHMGALLTDFLLIRPGALHKANGGVLMIDAEKVLTQPWSWEALKRALRGREIRIENPGERTSLVATVSIEPDPIPLELKVVMFGDRMIYYLLAERDPEFIDLFKVQADFDEVVVRDEEAVQGLSRFIAATAQRTKSRPLDAAATARIIEECARGAEDQERLLVLSRPIADLVREADHIARKADREIIGEGDVNAAIAAQIRRAERIRERQEEAILRDLILIDTQGAKVGQINGLTVSQLPGFAFGRPARITARVRPGPGEVVDIEREVALGGPIHAKGMLILQGYLSGHYAREEPLSLMASLVFEQSYGGVEGDSASAAELVALLSAIADTPLRQDLAITGSVNQHGQIQVIGGVNHKIEGFFDLCEKRGLTGTQGVAIPAGNVRNLMLREKVREAVGKGRFHIHALETIDDAIALFTGLTAGIRALDGKFEKESFNARVAARLAAFTRIRRDLLRGEGQGR
ncbi:MAG: AAA family ATPase [Alphaproteobacteria bacterium]|nr:AAA family ATPase [Alphaproteobacteria bacterium]